MKFKIIKANSVDHLEKKVNRLIKKGWKINGTMQIESHPEYHYYSMGIKIWMNGRMDGWKDECIMIIFVCFIVFINEYLINIA